MCIGFNRMRNLLILIFISSFLSGCLTGNNTFKTTENSTFKTIKVKELTKQEKNTIIKEKEWEENTKIRQAALKKKLEEKHKRLGVKEAIRGFKPIILKRAPGECYKDDNRCKPKILKNLSEEEIQAKFKNAKAECEEIGYKEGTEKFGQCVLDLAE